MLIITPVLLVRQLSVSCAYYSQPKAKCSLDVRSLLKLVEHFESRKLRETLACLAAHWWLLLLCVRISLIPVLRELESSNYACRVLLITSEALFN